ncbi:MULTISPECIES: CbtA family protein [Actinomycetes]|uniref:CbtA family protein n=1 Tax=Actinomycetes TaxID=1760 RepID=UPI0004270E66|nr:MULTISPECIES: CbtA family protein [Actinomycetes]TWG96995.1 putative cobalt transporter CbtA [Nocardioides sp. J9]
MNARTFLVRGLLAGLIAGIVAFGVAFTVGEPPIDTAIGLEEAAAAEVPAESGADEVHTHAEGDGDHTHAAAATEEGHAHSHGDEEEGGITRTTQKTWGLATATIAIGVALGGIIALIAAAVAGRLGRLTIVGSTALVTALGFVAYALVPFLKYPAAPPAVGSGDTIGSRTAYYFAFALISIVAMVATVFLGRWLAAARGAWTGVVVAGVAYVIVVAVAALAMPTVNELGAFPADVLWEFRISSVLTLAALWGALGVALTWLLGRVDTTAKAVV